MSVFECPLCGFRAFAVELAERHERRTGHDVAEVEVTS